MISPHAERKRRPGDRRSKDFYGVLHRDIATIPEFAMKLNGSAALDMDTYPPRRAAFSTEWQDP